MFTSGLTTLNLAISNKPDTFASPGNIVSYIGESDGGKTVLALTTLAASFYRYRVAPVFYAQEPNLEIDIERLFGKKFKRALKIETDLDASIESWQAEARTRLKRAKKPIAMALDSTDALKCLADKRALNGQHKSKKGEAVKTTVNEEGIKTKGTKAGMGAEAAAAWSRCCGEISKALASNKGLLIFLSQIRTKPGVVFGSPFYRSNGAALDFHSEIRAWLHKSTEEKINKVKVGGWTRIEVKRNKVTGGARTIYAPIYPVYGVDNTRSMLHFLADNNMGAEWANAEGMKSIQVGDKVMTLAKMAAQFEEPDLEGVLEKMVSDAWYKREEELRNEVLADRKPRFG